MNLELDFNILKALNVLSAKKDVRYYLQGVYCEFSPQGAFIVSTDGHKLGLYHAPNLPQPETVSFIIPRELIDQFAKVVDKKNTTVNLKYENHNITLSQGSLEFKKPEVEGKYPDWRRIIPDSVTNEPANFHSDYLCQFTKCVSILRKTPVDKTYFEIGYNGNNASIILCEGSNFLGVIMPYKTRLSAHEYKKPLWVNYPQFNIEK